MTADDVREILMKIHSDEKLVVGMELEYAKTYHIMESRVSDAGLDFVGMGMYSTVVKHSSIPNKVFKISTSRWDGYREYAKYCIERTGNKHIPTIYNMSIDDDFSLYELDEYKSINSTDISDEMVLVYMMGQNTQVPSLVQTISLFDCELTREMKQIISTFGDKFLIDLHLNNVMIDGENNIIITDPLGRDNRRTIHKETVKFNYTLCV